MAPHIGRVSRRGPLPAPDVQFSETTITRYAGAVAVLRYFNEVLELPQHLSHVARAEGRRRKHPVPLVLYAFLVGSPLGIEKLAHLEWLRGDCIVETYLRLAAWPVRKVFSEALASVSNAGVVAISKLLTAFALWSIRGRTSAVLDFDSTALVCFGTQEGAEFDEKEAIAFMTEAVARVRAKVPGSVSIRADAGFWSKAMGAWLRKEGIPFAFAMPLYAALKLHLMSVAFETVAEDDEDIEIGVLDGAKMGYDAQLRIIVIRRRVHDESAPPPGKAVGWVPEWRYPAIVTSTSWEPLDVWRFYDDRGDAERVFKTGKQALGLGWLCTRGRASGPSRRSAGPPALLLPARGTPPAGPQPLGSPPAGERPGRRHVGLLRPDARDRLSSSIAVAGPARGGEGVVCAGSGNRPLGLPPGRHEQAGLSS